MPGLLGRLGALIATSRQAAAAPGHGAPGGCTGLSRWRGRLHFLRGRTTDPRPPRGSALAPARPLWARCCRGCPGNNISLAAGAGRGRMDSVYSSAWCLGRGCFSSQCRARLLLSRLRARKTPLVMIHALAAASWGGRLSSEAPRQLRGSPVPNWTHDIDQTRIPGPLRREIQCNAL